MDLSLKSDFHQKELISAFDRRFELRTVDKTREMEIRDPAAKDYKQKKITISPALDRLFSGVENNKTAKDILKSVNGKRYF